MSNPFYSYSGSFIPGTLGRAEAVAAEFQSVQAGFADLATAGTDSGSATAYVVTTPAGQPAAPLVDGDQVSFRAANTNSGAATLNVNSTGSLALLQYNGGALNAGNIAAGSWYVVTYNSNFGGWCLPGAIAITFAGSISSAAPTYPVQLTAVGGISTSAMPIDAKLALSTAISPTWVGNHKFTGTSSFSGPVTISGTATISGPLSITAVMTFGAGVSFTAPASFSGTATVSGVLAVSGTSSFSGPLAISGSLTISGTSTASGPWSFTNKLTASGTSTFSGSTSLTAVTALTVTGTATFSGPTTFSGTSTFSTIKVTAASTFAGISATTGNFSGALTGFTAAFSPPSNGIGLLVTGNPTGATQRCIQINGPTSGTSHGMIIQAGLVAGDSAFYVRAADASQNFINVAGDGSGALGGPSGNSLTWSAAGAFSFSGALSVSGTATFAAANFSGAIVGNSATGGGQGPGTINATGFFVNGVAVGQSSTGTFTATYTGFTANPTGTARWSIAGNIVTLILPALTGTSNANTFTITGLPAAIQPAHAFILTVATLFEDQGIAATGATMSFAAGSGTITLLNITATGWTASSTKGALGAVCVTYMLN